MSDKYLDMRPLFSGASNGKYLDARSGLFVSRLLSLKNSYGDLAGENWKKDRDIFTAENYEDKKGARDQDIHPEFIKFIGDVGKYHKDLDASSKVNPQPALAAPGSPGVIPGNFVATNQNNNTSNPSREALHNFLTTNWNNSSFSGEFKDLYSFTLNLVDTKGDKIELGEYYGKGGDKDGTKVRFNMKLQKLQSGQEVTRFTNLLPTELQDVYQIGYTTGGYQALTEETYLKGYKPSALLHKLMDKANKHDSKLSSLFAESADPVFCHLYGRNDNGVLINDYTGVAVPEKNSTKIEDRCMTTQVKAKDSLECTKYVKQCLAGENIDECKEFFADSKSDFFRTTQEEVKNMHPEMALQTLKAFNFKTINEYDEDERMNIKKIEEYVSWMKNLSDSKIADAETLKAIGANNKLTQYLKWVVELVNCNPHILNKGLSKKGNNDSYDPNRFSHTSFSRMGLKARRPVRNSCYKDIHSIENLIKNYNVALGIRLNAPIIGGVVPVVSMVGGGSMVTINQAETSVNQLRESRKETSRLLHDLFNYLVGKLKAFNKDISQGDQNKIMQLIKDLEKKENNLYKIINMVEQYSVVVDIFGQERVAEEVDYDDMKKAVEARPKLFAKKVKRENDIISVLKALTEAVEKETVVNRSPINTQIN